MNADWRPSGPCSFCGATEFGIVKDVWIEVVCEEKKKTGNTLRPHFTVVICTTCNATHFVMKHTPTDTSFLAGFTESQDDHLLTACDHEILSVRSQLPYR